MHPSPGPPPPPLPPRYLLLDIGEGCQPANRMYITDLQQLKQGEDGAPDFALYDFFAGSEQLPLVKLVDDFQVGCWLGVAGCGWGLVWAGMRGVPWRRLHRARCTGAVSALLGAACPG